MIIRITQNLDLFDKKPCIISAGFTITRALGQDEIQGPQHRLWETHGGTQATVSQVR